MSDARGGPRTAIVAGDVTVDWYMAEAPGAGSGPQWEPRARSTIAFEFGGAALFSSLLGAVARQGATGWRVRGPDVPERPLTPTDRTLTHSFAIWSPYGKSRGEVAWRVSRHLGVSRASEDLDGPEGGRTRIDGASPADIVVLVDAGLGFGRCEERWSPLLRRGGGDGAKGPWVLYRVSSGDGEPREWEAAPLWRTLVEHHRDRLIVQIDASDLRAADIRIDRGNSWERTALDLVEAIRCHPRLSVLSRVAHVVVSLGPSGALLYSTGRGTDVESPDHPVARLAFDPAGPEGTFRRAHPGEVTGHGACLAAGLSGELMKSPGRPDLVRGMVAGLEASRRLHVRGYATHEIQDGPPRLAFPVDEIVAVLHGASREILTVGVPAKPDADGAGGGPAGVRRPSWTILEAMHGEEVAKKAAEIVRFGLREALPGVPRLAMGALETVDRREIEANQAIANQIARYCHRPAVERPLSIAVFGAPGSGKSFGIKQISKALFPGRIEPIGFNLSQLDDPAMLVDALHQVRDIGIGGKVPLVFWDEFDTSLGGRPLGWLRYFIAPMWDGEFQHGQLRHAIGRAIFVFAGGTAHRFEEFGPGLLGTEGGAARESAGSDGSRDHVREGRADATPHAIEAWKSLKGPDFTSRLSGYVDVLGPNPFGDPDAEVYEPDPFYLVRRAIVLRSLLERFHPGLFAREGGARALSIDPGVLRGLLHARQYRHGARSIEALLAGCSLEGRRHFDRSCLPPGRELALHIGDADDFRSQVDRWEPDQALLEAMARAAHKGFCERLRSRGVEGGNRTDPGADPPTHASLVEWDSLPADEREQSRDFVRDIPTKLRRIGYRLTGSDEGRRLEFESDEGLACLEELAEQEHRRWVGLKLARGWRWGARTDKANRVHEALLPWEYVSDEQSARVYGDGPSRLLGKRSLPEDEKEKDRELVASIPAVLERAGFFVLPVEEPARPCR